MSLSERFYRTSKTKKKMFALFVAFVILLMFGINTVSANDEIVDKIADNDIRNMVQIKNGINDLIRKFEFEILSFLSKAIDFFQEAVDTILKINMYDFIKDKFSTNAIYPLAWALFSLALIILGIIFIWNNDKVRITESAKSIIMSALIIITLPSFFGALDEMKEIGVNDVKDVSGNNEFSLGQDMLLMSVVDLTKCGSGEFKYFKDSPIVSNIVDGSDVDGQIPKYQSDLIDFKLESYINAAAEHDTIGGYMSNGQPTELKDAPEGDIDKLIATIKNMGYPVEKAYLYYIDFWYNLVLMIITIICLIFAGVKLAGMLFNLLFMQIISPIVVATDLNGSGRAKKIVQNILSTYIIFIVVVLLLRIYLLVMHGMRTKDYNFAVLIMLTIAGAKFVIDGPDIIVQILGIDAGVKSGAATLMGLHSAAQMANGVVKGSANAVRNVAAVPAKVSETVGKAAAVSNEIASANGIGGKLKAAAGNSHVGQAFKQAYSGQSQTNDLYNDAKAKYKAPQNSEPAAEPMKSQEQGSKYNSSAGNTSNNATAETGSVGQSVNQNEHSSERNNSTAQTATTQSTATQGKAFENQHQNNNSPSSSEDAANHSQQSQSSVSEPTFPQQEMSSEREKTTFAQSEYSSEQSNNVQAKSEQPKKEEMNNGNDTQTNEK